MLVREEVRSFISGCEKIHELLVGGGRLTEDESGVIEMAAIELLTEMGPKNGPPLERPWLL